jgi:predicted ATPase/DNA-binding SARP family transcriptional activator
LDGSPVDTSRHKAIALLVYLAVTGERQRREALATLLWPDYEQSKAYAYLRRTLWEIKEMMGEGWLDADRELVGFAMGTERWLDVAEFRRMLAATATHGHASAAVCPACIEPLSRAAELYRGDFLAGFSLRDSPGFDDWQFYLAEGLRQEAGEALRKLSAIHGRQRELDAAIDYGRRWLALDPLNEEAHRQVMLLHALHGQRSAALRQYQECVRLLESEMGIAPERKTTELFQRIEQGKIPALEPAETVFAVAEPPATSDAMLGRTVHNTLPQLLTPFVGRERELAELHSLLGDPDVRLLTILAVGGMGKTRMGIEAAGRQVERFEHGAVFVYLAPLNTAEALAPALLDALELTRREGALPKTQVLDYLREKRLLLVLDNFEHLLEGAGLVTDILQAAPGVKVLVTSRLPLNVQGEHRYHLVGMDFPTTEHLDEALDTSAVKLFVQGARRALPGFRLNNDDVQPVVAICRLADGMPLAILLAAGWVGLLSPLEIAAQMRSQRDFLETELHDVPERQRSMRLVMQQAWDYMTEPERAAFASLSVFRGSFDRQAAQEVSGASLRVLMSLLDKSLLARLANDRLVVHELLRQYAAERLAEAADAYEIAHDRHSALYCRRLQAWAETVKHPSRSTTAFDIDADQENIQVAWNWAVLGRRVARLTEASEGLGLLFALQNRDQSGEAVFRAAVDALSPPTSDEERVLVGYLLARQARHTSHSAREGAVLVERSLTYLAGVAGSSQALTSARAFAWFVRGRTARDTADWHTGQAAFEKSLSLYEQLGDSWWAAIVLQNLSGMAWTLDDRDRAKLYFQRSLALSREIGDKVRAAHLLQAMGDMTGFDDGQVDEAETYLLESSRLFVAIGGRMGEYNSLGPLQSAAWLRGRFSQALEIVHRRQAFAREQGTSMVSGATEHRMAMGELLQLIGSYDSAERENSGFIAEVLAAGWAHVEIWVRPLMAATLLALGRYSEARQALQSNIAALEQAGQNRMLGRTLAMAGRAELGLGNLAAAWGHALRAVQLLSGWHYFWLLEAMAAAAAVLAERGEAERAVEIYALLNRHEFVANARWFGDVFGQVVEKASANLPPDTVAAAQARGETLDLWQAAQELLVEHGASEIAGD